MSSSDDSAARGRWAVAAAFFVNGFLVGGWALQIPLIPTRLGITEGVLGLLILVLGLGSLVSMPWCGYLAARHGSRVMTAVTSVACCFALLPVAFAPNVLTAVPAFFALGAVIGAMDVAMNANAVAVERRLGRAIMSSSHGFWSLGGFAGGASSGLIIAALGHLGHAAVMTVAALAVILPALRHLAEADKPASPTREPFRLPRNPLIYLIGFIALLSMIPEGAVLDWAAIYLKQELGAGIALAGFAFAAFSATMAATRFAGDRIRNRFGAVVTLRLSALLAATGMLAAGLAPNAATAIAAFALAGLGIANMMPIAFSAAGNQPGLAAGTGISVATTMGYSGILVAPSLIGFVGERIGFAPVFVAIAFLLLVVAGLAGRAGSADFVVHQPAE